jgi:hypothetical protein
MKSKISECYFTTFEQTFSAPPIIGGINVDPLTWVDDQGQYSVTSHGIFACDSIRPGCIDVARLPIDIG